MENAEEESLSLQITLNQLIDESNTPLLDSTVLVSTPDQSASLHQELLSISPYLSNDVMESAIVKEDVLPSAMIRDILVANPQSAKIDSLLDKLENRNNPLPSYMWVEILQGENIIGAKESIEASISHWNHNRYFHWNNLFRYYNHESNDPTLQDSLTDLLQNEPDVKAKYELAFLQASQGDYQTALTTISQIPNQIVLDAIQMEDWQNMGSYLTVLSDLLSNNPITFHPGAALELSFNDLMNGAGEMTSIYARNILLNAGLTAYNEPILLNESLKAGRKERIGVLGNTSSFKESDFLKVFPNPAGDYFIAETHLEYEHSSGKLQIIDLMGRNMLTLDIHNQIDQTVINVKNFVSGFYFVTLIEGEKVLSSVKISIK